MAFSDFTFPEVCEKLSITVIEADLFSDVIALPLRDEFSGCIREDADLALAVNTEKARSEFIIAPVLLELRRSLAGNFGLFSGVELNVDSTRGLNGFCDFILSRTPRQMILTAPLVAIVEAKNDNLRQALGQCIAAMVAIQEFNSNAKSIAERIHGVVTTGSSWKFLRLQGAEIAVDTHEYYIVDIGKIMGILTRIMRET